MIIKAKKSFFLLLVMLLLMFLVDSLPVLGVENTIKRNQNSDITIRFDGTDEKPAPPIKPDPPVNPPISPSKLLPKTGELIMSLIILLIGIGCLLIGIGVYALKVIMTYSVYDFENDINEIFI